MKLNVEEWDWKKEWPWVYEKLYPRAQRSSEKWTDEQKKRLVRVHLLALAYRKQREVREKQQEVEETWQKVFALLPRA